MAHILVLHGPNLNLLGNREPKQYGRDNLEQINQLLKTEAKALHHQLIVYQSNAEHELINTIHQYGQSRDNKANNPIDCIIFNPAAFTHTSIALRDALLAVQIPFIEVHLSNIFQREAFRQTSYFSDIAVGVISGFGTTSYLLALQAAHNYLLTN